MVEAVQLIGGLLRPVPVLVVLSVAAPAWWQVASVPGEAFCSLPYLILQVGVAAGVPHAGVRPVMHVLNFINVPSESRRCLIVLSKVTL